MMSKGTIHFIVYRVLLPLPVLATLLLALRDYQEVSFQGMLNTHLSNPLIWILDAIFVSSALLAYVFMKSLNDDDGGLQGRRLSSSLVYRSVGLAWGLLTYGIATLSIIFYDHQRVTVDLFIQYQTKHPLLIGLLFCIPFFYCLGYIIEKMFVIKEENRLKSLEIEQQNALLQREVNDRKQREADLIEAKKEAMMGAKTKDQFLSNMSHEIRTPMNGVMGLASLLLDTELTEEQREYASSIEYSAKNLLVLINQILDLSKINSEKLNLEYIDFDVKTSIKTVENTFKSTAAEKGIILRTVVDSQVPTIVSGDPVRFNQILLNVVGNAVKFTKEGGVDLIVKSTTTDDGPRLSIQVNDTGIGIPKDKLSAIFEDFSQASSETTRMYGGTGLGLAISKELVELYGGAMKVESLLGKGSSFSFDLQLKNRQG